MIAQVDFFIVVYFTSSYVPYLFFVSLFRAFLFPLYRLRAAFPDIHKMLSESAATKVRTGFDRGYINGIYSLAPYLFRGLCGARY